MYALRVQVWVAGSYKLVSRISRKKNITASAFFNPIAYNIVSYLYRLSRRIWVMNSINKLLYVMPLQGAT